MANSGLTITHFKELLLTYGVDIRRWPEVSAADVEALLASSPEACELLAEYAPVDQLMQAGKDDTPPADLLSKIMDKIEKK